MKNRLLKILFLTLFGCASFYLFKSWKIHKEKTSFEVDSFEFSQAPLDLTELSTSFSRPVWFIKTDSPVICFEMLFRNEGDRSFHASPVISTLLDGAGSRDGIALKKALDEKSIKIIVDQGYDNITVTVSCLEKYFEFAADLLCDIMSKAHLKREKLEISKQGCITSMQQAKFSTFDLAFEKLYSLIYSKDHPYRWSYDERIEAIKKYSKDDADKCYASIFNPKNAVITIAGNIDPERVTNICGKIYNSIAGKKNDFKDGQQRTDLKNYGKVAHVELDNAQATVLVAFPGVLRTDPNRFAARLANTGVGGCSFVSRLVKRLRDVDGLVYRTGSQIVNNDLQSYVVVNADTRPENISNAIRAIKDVCKELCAKGFTQEELDELKTFVYANGDLISNAEKVSFVSSCRIDGTPLNEVNSYSQNYFNLKLEDVNAAIRLIFDPDKSVTVSCGVAANREEVPVKPNDSGKVNEEEKK
ncbi:MAG: insulinase family protein [Holosporales bacterium]|jgi:zinc protease|nr:insulinase family protein [Holosporales bacterium]